VEKLTEPVSHSDERESSTCAEDALKRRAMMRCYKGDGTLRSVVTPIAAQTFDPQATLRRGVGT